MNYWWVLDSTMKHSRSSYIPYPDLLQTDSTHHRNDMIVEQFVILLISFAFASWIIVEFEIILRNTEDLLYVSCLGLLQTDTTYALYHELSDGRTYVFNRTGCQKLSMSRVFIRHWKLKNSPFTVHNSLANVHHLSLTILYSDVEHLSKYSPVTLHLSPATGIFI